MVMATVAATLSVSPSVGQSVGQWPGPSVQWQSLQCSFLILPWLALALAGSGIRRRPGASCSRQLRACDGPGMGTGLLVSVLFGPGIGRPCGSCSLADWHSHWQLWQSSLCTAATMTATAAARWHWQGTQAWCTVHIKGASAILVPTCHRLRLPVEVGRRELRSEPESPPSSHWHGLIISSSSSCSAFNSNYSLSVSPGAAAP